MRRSIFIIFISLLFFSATGEAKQKFKYQVSVCAMFQNEADFLKEWIEYHRIIGAEHFWLYNNSSDDHYKEVLKPYIESGIVELFDWPSPTNIDWTPTQATAYNNCLQRARGVTRWLAVIDIDEYIVPKNCYNLQQFLKPYEKVGGIIVNWQMFGTSGIWEIPEGCLMTECLYRKAEKNAICNTNQKSIVQPHFCLSYNIHYANYINGYGHSYPKDPGSGVPIKQIQINHYWLRNEKFMREVKAPRRARYEGALWNETQIQYYIDYHDKEDDFSIQKYLPALRKAVFQ